MRHPRILVSVGRSDFFKDEIVETDVRARCAAVLALFVEVLVEEAVQMTWDGEKRTRSAVKEDI